MGHRRPYFIFLLPLLIGCGAGSSERPVQDSRAEQGTAGAVSVVPNSPQWNRTIDGFAEQVAEHVIRDDVGGLVAGVVVDGELAWAKGYGWADRENQVPMNPSAVFRTASITRAVTATLLMRLVDRGVIGLDDPVEPYVPEIARVQNRLPEDPDVTFRHLASHTAGLERNYSEGLAGPVDRWQEGVIQAFPNLAYDTVPGTRFQDLPVGYGALGLALERAAGERFVDLVQREVFDRLGMTSSSFVVQGSDLEPRVATAYPNRRGGGLDRQTAARQFGGWGYTLPSSGMYSTVADLGRLLGAITGVSSLEILSESSRRELTSAQTPGGLDPPWPKPRRGVTGRLRGGRPAGGVRTAIFRDGEGSNVVSPEVLDPPQGLGVAIHVDGDGHTIVHDGGIVAGYTAYMAVDTETRIGVVMLRNYWRGSTDLRQGAIGLVSQLSALARGRSSRWGSLLPILIVVTGALLAGALFNRFLGPSPDPRSKRR